MPEIDTFRIENRAEKLVFMNGCLVWNLMTYSCIIVLRFERICRGHLDNKFSMIFLFRFCPKSFYYIFPLSSISKNLKFTRWKYKSKTNPKNSSHSWRKGFGLYLSSPAAISLHKISALSHRFYHVLLKNRINYIEKIPWRLSVASRR